MAEHSTLTGASLHEPKGAAAANDKDTLRADGAGGSVFEAVRHNGWWDYGDVTTQSTPIALTLADTDYDLTNDGAGANSSSTRSVPASTEIWNTSTNRFDWTNLEVSDTMDLRVDVEFTTGAVNTGISMALILDVGGLNVNIPLLSGQEVKTAGSIRELGYEGFYIGNSTILAGPAKIVASADKTGTTIKVNGWYIRVTKYLP
jgi:hypothetical protein